MPKGISTKLSRAAKVKAQHPEWTAAQVADFVRLSYRSRDPEKLARQKSNLQPHARKHRHTSQSIAAGRASASDLANMNVIDFASGVLGLKLYPAQAVILKALYGLRLDAAELKCYGDMTGGRIVDCGPSCEADEAVLCLGARAGKSLLASVVALFETVCRAHRWRQSLRKSELGYCVVTATRLAQGVDIITGNCARMAQDSEVLRPLIAGEVRQDQITFKNGLAIRALPCTNVAGRGIPIYCLIFDEIAHYFVEGPRADSAIYNALAPRLSQFSGAKTILASTPAAKQGTFHKWFSEGFSVPDRLTVQAGTSTMNPSIDARFLEKMRLRDSDNYEREFLAQFAEQVACYFAADRLDGAFVLAGDIEPKPETPYFMGLDQSGLSGRDKFACAITHEDGGVILSDVVRSWDSTDADYIMGEVAALAKRYGITSCLTDQYGAGWVRAALEKIGLTVGTRPSLPMVYSNLKSLLTAGRLRLTDNQELRNGLLNTQAYYGRNNALSIQHERSGEGHSDLADAIATSTWSASGRTPELQRAFSDADLERCLKVA